MAERSDHAPARQPASGWRWGRHVTDTAAATSAAITIARLSKTFDSRMALDDINLTVQRGEMTALIGPSGSGKSTLLRAAAGLIAADKGSGPLTIDGALMQENGALAPGARRARQQIGFIFQQYNLVDRISVYANTLIGALGRMGVVSGSLGRFSNEDRARAMAALERVGLADYARQRAGTLSGGQKQRTAIARALVQGADLMLADEPIASLDPVSARKVMQLLAELNKTEGITVVVSLHQIDYALQFCPRVIALKDGHVVYDGPNGELSRDRLVDVYGAEYEDAFWQGEAA